jgi:hypothetical protein
MNFYPLVPAGRLNKFLFIIIQDIFNLFSAPQSPLRELNGFLLRNRNTCPTLHNSSGCGYKDKLLNPTVLNLRNIQKPPRIKIIAGLCLIPDLQITFFR